MYLCLLYLFLIIIIFWGGGGGGGGGRESSLPMICSIHMLYYSSGWLIYRIYSIKRRPRINAAPNQKNAAFIRGL